MGSVALRSFVSPLAVAVPRFRWFRLTFSPVRVRYWASRAAAVSFVLHVGSRLVLVFVLRVWPWFLVVRGGFILFFLCSAPRVGRPRPKLGNLRCKLIVFK